VEVEYEEEGVSEGQKGKRRRRDAKSQFPQIQFIVIDPTHTHHTSHPHSSLHVTFILPFSALLLRVLSFFCLAHAHQSLRRLPYYCLQRVTVMLFISTLTSPHHRYRCHECGWM
jgi:hypothetical protein